MNIKRIKELRKFISKLPKKACDMHTWRNAAINKKTDEEFTPEEMQKRGFKCGTVGCLGGWTEAMMKLKRKYRNTPMDALYAHRYLELTGNEDSLLFYSYPYPDDNFNWKQWMLARLDGIIKDGYVDTAQHQMREVRHNGYNSSSFRANER